MTFRQISEVALDGVSAELQAKYGWHTDTGAATNAPRSVAPQIGGGNPLRMGDKNAGALAPASADKGGNYPSGGDAPVYLRVVSDSNRCMPRKPHTDAPRGLGIHLVLVVDNGWPVRALG